MVILRVPVVVGLKATTKEVEAAAASVTEGCVVKEKKEVPAPVKYGVPMFKMPVPELVITNVLLPAAIKLVLFNVEVEVDPSVMELPFPLSEMDAVGAFVVVNPFATPPGLTQFDVVPVVNAKLVSVPVLLPAASVNKVLVLLLNPAAP